MKMFYRAADKQTTQRRNRTNRSFLPYLFTTRVVSVQFHPSSLLAAKAEGGRKSFIPHSTGMPGFSCHSGSRAKSPSSWRRACTSISPQRVGPIVFWVGASARLRTTAPSYRGADGARTIARANGAGLKADPRI